MFEVLVGVILVALFIQNMIFYDQNERIIRELRDIKGQEKGDKNA